MAQPRLLLSQFEVREILHRELGPPGWLGPLHSPLFPGRQLHMVFGDSRYYVPSRRHIAELMQDPVVDLKGQRDWKEEIYDCDEFAFMLRAHVINRAYYRNNYHEREAFVRRSREVTPAPTEEPFRPYAFGIVWATGKDPTSVIGDTEHAFNWVLVRAEESDTSTTPVAGEPEVRAKAELLFIEPNRQRQERTTWFRKPAEIRFAPGSIRLLLA